MYSDHTNCSRRTFLGTGAAALAGLALVGRHAFGVDAPAATGDIFDGLPMGVQSYTLRDRSFEKALEAIKNDLKLSHVEIFPGHITALGPTKVKELLDAHGITVTGFGVVHFSKDIEANRKHFELAKTLGIPHLTCDPDPNSFDNLDKLTEEYKITADIHDHGPGHRWAKIDVISEALKDHSQMIGLCNDTGHFIRAGEDPLRACTLFRGRMHAMHLKDFKKNEKGNWEDCALGTGELKLELMIDWLLENKFTGDLSLEYEGKNPVEVCTGDLARISAAVAKSPKKSK